MEKCQTSVKFKMNALRRHFSINDSFNGEQGKNLSWFVSQFSEHVKIVGLKMANFLTKMYIFHPISHIWSKFLNILFLPKYDLAKPCHWTITWKGKDQSMLMNEHTLKVKSSLLNDFTRLLYIILVKCRCMVPVFLEAKAVGISIWPFKKASNGLTGRKTGLSICRGCI